MSETIDLIRHWHRRRVFAMDQRKRADLALGAFLRTQLGWTMNLPAEERNVISERADGLITYAEREMAERNKPSKKVKLEPDAAYSQWRDVIMAALEARGPFDMIEDEACGKMEELAETLPVWLAFGEPIKGFGKRSLAVIVAEAGDLSGYANPGKLWKRMGLAPIQKGDVTKAGSTWRKGGLNAEEWTEAGYSMKRRATMFVIGDVLIKNQGSYRDIYLARKEYERQQAAARGLTVVPAAKIPKKNAGEFMSDGHIHRRAQRYMEKRFLMELWVAWCPARGRVFRETQLRRAA